MKVRYSYLPQQFSDCDDLWSELKDFVKTGDFTLGAPLKKFEANNSLIILDKISKEKIFKSLRNIPNIKVSDINHFNVFDILKYKKLIFTESSVKELEKKFS